MEKTWKLDICPEDTESLLGTNSNEKSASASSWNRRKIHRRPRSMLQTFVCGSICITGVFLLIYIPMFSHYNSRIYPLPNWGLNTSRNTSDYVLPNRDTVIVQPRNVCDTENHFFLLIMVSSALGNFQARWALLFTQNCSLKQVLQLISGKISVKHGVTRLSSTIQCFGSFTVSSKESFLISERKILRDTECFWMWVLIVNIFLNLGSSRLWFTDKFQNNKWVIMSVSNQWPNLMYSKMLIW